jgi:DNA-binding CsgD family transcriptional regulator
MDAAEQTAQELLASIDRIALGPDDRALIVALGARIATARGELCRAADELAGTVVPTTLRYREYLTLADAELAVATGDFDRAGERLQSTATTDALLPGLHRAVVAAELAVRTGEPSVAREIVGSKLDLAEVYPEVTHLRLCALALEATADDDAAADDYRARAERKYEALARHPVIAAPAVDALVEAVRLHHALVRHLPPPPSAEAGIRAADQAGLRLQAGWSRLLLARCLVESGTDRAGAGRLAAEVHGWASAAGAGPLRSATDDLARRARLDVGGVARATDGDLGLTEREAEVLKLVAAGRTNREVAAQLYISPKTASVHVSNILRKVGAANRGEAAAVAHRRGLVVAP